MAKIDISKLLFMGADSNVRKAPPKKVEIPKAVLQPVKSSVPQELWRGYTGSPTKAVTPAKKPNALQTFGASFASSVLDMLRTTVDPKNLPDITRFQRLCTVAR